jgi:peptide subunit release factor 1 (eRF1)
VTVKCTNCSHVEYVTIRRSDIAQYEQKVVSSACPKCNNPTLVIADTKDLIDEFADLADKAEAEVEIISGQTEEGVELKDSFGGIVAILKSK